MNTLFIGNETYLSLKNAKLYIKELLKEGNVEYVMIDGEKTESFKIIDTLSSQSLFNLPKVIFLKNGGCATVTAVIASFFKLFF